MDTNSGRPAIMSTAIEKESFKNLLQLDESKKGISSANSLNALEIQQAIDHATGLLQTIVSDKISGEVLLKMPPDEYLNLLTMLDDIISGSSDKRI